VQPFELYKSLVVEFVWYVKKCYICCEYKIDINKL